MKIGMWNIYDKLPYDNIIAMIKDGTETIEAVRWIVYSFLNNHTVYVGEASGFFYGEQTGTVIVHRKDFLLVPDSDPEEVFNEVCTILDQYREWESNLNMFLSNENGLSHMLDCSAPIFENPMFIYAPDGKTLAISSGYPPELHWHWKELIENDGLTEERMRSLRDKSNLTKVFQDLTPTLHESSMGMNQYIHCSILANRYMAGHFVLFSLCRPFEKGTLYLCSVLVQYISRYMEKYYSQYSSTSKLGKIAVSMLSSSTYDEDQLHLLLSTLKWKENDYYRVYAIQENVTQEPVMLNRMYIRLTETYRDAIVFRYKKQLIILANRTRDKGTSDIKRHLPHLIEDNYICGISQDFQGIKKCREYYEQAVYELNNCMVNKTVFSDASEHGWDFLYDIIQKNELSATYVHRGLLRLYYYDLNHKTSYYETLRAFVYSGFQPSAAGYMLNIHRNSVNYRLEKIKELIDFQEFYELMNSMDINRLNYLHFSFAYIDSMQMSFLSETGTEISK